MARRVLVISYEFPPSGGGGVQRIAKFCRYLPSHGWQPSVVTAEPVSGRSLDASLVDEVTGVRVIRAPARHVSSAVARAMAPLKALRKHLRKVRASDTAVGAGSVSTSQDASGLARPSLSSRVARWIAVPDDAVLWRRGAVRACVASGRADGVDVVFASGPPFSAIVVGSRAAKALGVPFVADMRDGWADNPVVRMPTRAHAACSARQESRALSRASVVTCTTPAIADEAATFGGGETMLIPNGFDPADLPPHVPDPAGPLRIAYMGKVYFGHSDPTGFLRVLAALGTEAGPASRIVMDLVGSWPPAIEEAAKSLRLAERVRFRAYLPHREALALVACADLGLVLIADRPGAAGSAPAKMYEYMGMGLPTLLVGPADGYPAQVLAETGAGVRVSPGDDEALAATLRSLAEAKAAGRSLATPDPDAVARYRRTDQARALAGILDRAAVSR